MAWEASYNVGCLGKEEGEVVMRMQWRCSAFRREVKRASGSVFLRWRGRRRVWQAEAVCGTLRELPFLWPPPIVALVLCLLGLRVSLCGPL